MTLNINSTSGNQVKKVSETTFNATTSQNSEIPVIGLKKDVFTRSPEALKDKKGDPIVLADASCNHGTSQAIIGAMYGHDKVTDSMLEQRKDALDRGCKIRHEEEAAATKAKEDAKTREADLETKKKATGYKENGTWGVFKDSMWCTDSNGKKFYGKPEGTFNTKTNSGQYVNPRAMMRDLGYSESDYIYANTYDKQGVEKYAIVKKSDIKYENP